MSFSVGNRLIAALDAPTRREADALVARLGGAPSWVKIGLELFCAEGPSIVRDYIARGLSVMLDLKLHDIPETVARATAGSPRSALACSRSTPAAVARCSRPRSRRPAACASWRSPC